MAKTAFTTRLHNSDIPSQGFVVELFSFQAPSIDHFAEDAKLALLKDGIREVVRSAWSKKDEKAIQEQMEYIAGDDIFEIVRLKDGAKNGRVIAFHSYKLRDIATPLGTPVKLLYIRYSAAHQEYQQQSIPEIAEMKVIEKIDPDVLATSTAHAAVYIRMQRIAGRRGYALFPNESLVVPKNIFELGKNILRAVLGEAAAATVDARLVRTYRTPTSRTERPFPLFNDEQALHLGPNQAVLMIAERPDLR